MVTQSLSLVLFKDYFKVRLGFERDSFQGECPKLGHWEKAACLLTLLSCEFSIFSIAPSDLNINHIMFSYKAMKDKSKAKSHHSVNKLQSGVTEVEHVNRGFQQQVRKINFHVWQVLWKTSGKKEFPRIPRDKAEIQLRCRWRTAGWLRVSRKNWILLHLIVSIFCHMDFNPQWKTKANLQKQFKLKFLLLVSPFTSLSVVGFLPWWLAVLNNRHRKKQQTSGK